jgi:pimeloyl-ACP methyl ester carboxylesterase
MTHHVIYIPGLGDNKNVSGQRFAVGLWRIWGVKPHLYQMKWADGKPFQEKFDGLLTLIDVLTHTGSVSLVGSSAGATAAINAYASRSQHIQAVVCIAGKINNPQTIGPYYLRDNPAFGESAQLAVSSLAQLDTGERQHILSLFAAVDPVVPARDSIVEGAINRRLPTAGHAVTIATQLIFGAPWFLHFIKHQKQQ